MPDYTGISLGKYTLTHRLGRGGMAEVYQAHHPSLNRNVAIKLIHPHLADDPNFIERFQREAQAIAQLHHPNIVQVFDFDTQDGLPYMVMEYIAGRTLKEILDETFQRGERLPLTTTLAIMRALLPAIGYAHARGMIHRDLKPANVMLEFKTPENSSSARLQPSSFRTILTDFGIAKILSAPKLTATGIGVGTPAYMSPEQGQGDSSDPRSDLYSLGIILYELLTGAVPYDGDSSAAVIIKHIQAPVPSLRQPRPDLPDPYDDIIAKALAKNPSDRYQTADEFLAALGFLENQTETPSAYATQQVTSPRAGVSVSLAKPTPAGTRAPGALSVPGLVGLLVVAALLISAIIFLPRLNRPSPIATPHSNSLSTAQAYLNSGKAQLAADSYNTLLATDPNNLDARLGLSQAHEALGQIPEAVSDLDDLLAAAPETAVAYEERARLNVQYGLSDDATAILADFNKAIELAPDSARAYYLRGWAILNFPLVGDAPNPQAALTDLQKAVTLDAQNPETQFTLARALLAAEQPNEALAPATRALELDPQTPPYRIVRAYINTALGDYHSAIDDLTTAIELITDPTPLSALYAERAYLYYKLGDTTRAQSDMEQARALDPTSTIVAITRLLLDPTLARPADQDLELIAATIPDDVIWQMIVADLIAGP